MLASPLIEVDVAEGTVRIDGAPLSPHATDAEFAEALLDAAGVVDTPTHGPAHVTECTAVGYRLDEATE